MPSGRGDTDVDFCFVDPAFSLKSIDKCFSGKDLLRFRREDQKSLNSVSDNGIRSPLSCTSYLSASITNPLCSTRTPTGRADSSFRLRARPSNHCETRRASSGGSMQSSISARRQIPSS